MISPIKSIKRHPFRWLLVFTVLLAAGGAVFYFTSVSATFQGNNGNLAFTTSTNIGRLRTQTYTFGSPGTYGTAHTSGVTPSASAPQHIVAKASPVRNEQLYGYQLNNGRLYVDRCSGSCTANADVHSDAIGAVTTILGSNVVTRAFDIAYEQLSGRAMLVYAGNTTGKLYYCIWDGTSWGPVSNCAPTNGSNDITLSDGTTTLTGTPNWVRLVPRGEQFTDNRTNDILMAVEDTNNDIYTVRWTGSSWNTSDDQVLTTTGGATVATTDSGNQISPAFDVGWETTSGLEMAVYADGTALKYRTSTGSGWSASGTTIATYATAAQWVRLAGDPLSNRMSLITAFGGTTTVGSTSTATPYIWKTDGTTVGWTAYTTLTMAQDAGQNISTTWLKANTGTSKALFAASANANTQQPDWSSWVPTTFTAWAALSTTSGDILTSLEMTPSPNSDIVTMIHGDRDGRLRARTFNGSAWGAIITTNLTTTLINTTTGRTTNKTYMQKNYQFTYIPYATWSMNWRVYNDEATAGNPTTALAPEGVTPQVTPNNIVRLRMEYAELGGAAEGDTRKKLQYSSGAGCPDSTSCTWTDVGAQGGGSIWRYADGGGTDNSAVSSTSLTGADTVGYYVENGTASASGELQSAGDLQEYDYTIQNNGATIGTTYYFRGYDYGPSASGGSATNLNPIYRRQNLDSSGTEQTTCTTNGAASVCTYPSLQSYTNAPQSPIIYSPLSGATQVADSPLMQIRTSDAEGDYVKYVIEWCPTNSWPCAAGGGTFDQTSSQTGWQGQDANSSTAYYTSSVSEAGSTMGEYQVSPGVFSPNTTYYLRAKAIDPGGSNSYSSYSSTYSFTTGTTDVRIQGGTTINGGTVIQ